MPDNMPGSELIDAIACVCHEANRAWCNSQGDLSHEPWHKAPEWQRRSVIDGVRLLIANPHAGPEACHRVWMAQKIREGWVYGSTKDPALKIHPDLLPHAELPMGERLKDYLFCAIVRALTSGAQG